MRTPLPLLDGWTRFPRRRIRSHQGAANLYSEPPHPQTESRLCQLPVELLHLIKDELPIHARATLALSCKLMAYKQGTSSWPASKHDDEERQVFLDLLSKDHPRLLPCHTCLRLHDREQVQRSPSLHREAGYLNIDAPDRECQLSFAYVQLAMACHRVSPEYDFLAYTNYTKKTISIPGRTAMVDMTMEFSIVMGRFLFKVQTRRGIDVQAGIRYRSLMRASPLYAGFLRAIAEHTASSRSSNDPCIFGCSKYELLFQGY